MQNLLYLSIGLVTFVALVVLVCALGRPERE
jgi:hypothetical protein